MTLQCLKTLEHQGIATIVLVDNSADANEHQQTLELAKFFTKGWLKIIIAPENLGFAKGMNLAWQHAQTLGQWDYALILNNDMEVEPTLVKHLCQHMQTHPRTGMVTATTNTPHGLQGKNYYHRWTGLLFKKPVLGSFLFLGGHCLLVRATAIINELFDTTYFMYGEDIVLNWQLAQQGWTLTVLPEILINHTSGSSSKNGSFFYEYHINRWHLLIIQTLGKNAIERFIMYSLRTPILFTRAILRSWRFRKLTPLKALGLSLSSTISQNIKNIRNAL
jgi:GT2 family glycosyltransferase